MVGKAVAQPTLYLEPRLGYGSFSMKHMQEFQQTLMDGILVDAEATDEFGAYFQFGLNVVGYLSEHSRAGLFLERGSTGGRVIYEDYSGEIRYDSFVSYNALGLLYYIQKPFGAGPLHWVAGAETNFFMSRLKVAGYTRIYESSDSSEEKFNSFGLGLKPYLGLQYPVRNFPVQLTLGYLASMNGPFHVPGNPDHYLVRNHNNDKLTPNWSGVRLNLSVSIPISR